jgi:hypothetical protein
MQIPAARGERLGWDTLPDGIQAAVEDHFQSTVEQAITQLGGFSPAVAARLRLADGRRVFAKAVGPEPNAESPCIYRAEAAIAAALPVSAPTPRLLWCLDDGGWVVLVFEDVEGSTPTVPWRPHELARVLQAVNDLAVALTPTPLDVATMAARLDQQFHGWRHLQAAGGSYAERLTQTDPWAGRHLDQLARLEAEWPEAAGGDTLVHCDIRADNVLLTAEGVVFVDWPWASVGPAWADLLMMLPSVAMQGGPAPWLLFDDQPVAAGAPAEAVTAVLAGLAGFFIWGSYQAPPPGLGTLRPFQHGQAVAAISWLRQRTGWP